MLARKTDKKSLEKKIRSVALINVIPIDEDQSNPLSSDCNITYTDGTQARQTQIPLEIITATYGKYLNTHDLWYLMKNLGKDTFLKHINQKELAPNVISDLAFYYNRDKYLSGRRAEREAKMERDKMPSDSWASTEYTLFLKNPDRFIIQSAHHPEGPTTRLLSINIASDDDQETSKAASQRKCIVS